MSLCLCRCGHPDTAHNLLPRDLKPCAACVCSRYRPTRLAVTAMSWGNGKRSRRLVHCLRCERIKYHEARGLCKCCYNKVHTAGELARYELTTGGLGSAIALDGGEGYADRLRLALDPSRIPLREARREAAA